MDPLPKLIPDQLVILLAEDDRLSAAMTSAVLSEAGYAVRHVTDGLAALRELEQGGIDLVVSDWRMPLMAGVDLCRAIRERPELESLYVILVTAMDDTRHVVEGLNAGADDYLSKPFDPDELEARVRAGLRIVSLQRRLTSANGALERMAMTDPLTDLPNRRAFDQILDSLTASAPNRTWLGIIDVDRLKEVNDNHGHAVGDLALVSVADKLRSASRASDCVVRLGGDEFGVIIQAPDAEHAKGVCDRLAAAVAEPITTSTACLLITASFGLAPMVSGDASADVLRRADTALYAAKNSGRNRIELWDGSDESGSLAA